MTPALDHHRSMKHEARRWFRGWARNLAQGGPKPPNGAVLRAGAILGTPQPGALLEALVEVARQDPDALVEPPEVGHG